MAANIKKRNHTRKIIIAGFLGIYMICYYYARFILDNDSFVTILYLIMISLLISSIVWYFTTDYLQPYATISNDSILFYERRFMAFIHRKPKSYQIFFSNFLYVFTIGKTVMIQTKDGEIYMIKEKQVDNMTQFHDILLIKLKPLSIKVHHMEDPLLQLSE